MIQLVFDAADAAAALGEEPVAVGYSSHEGAESADWGEDKLELVDGTHPVVYPAAGSHANKYTEALYLGSSAEAGVGCDDTRGPHVELRPVVKTIPSDPAAAAAAFPWIEFEGRWGELQPAFFNGPTGPNLKQQWTEPIAWSEGWRDRSYARAERAGSSARARPTSSAPRSRPARRRSSRCSAAPASRSSCSRCCSRSRSSRSRGRRGARSPRSASRAAGRGARSSPRPGGCTCHARRSFLGIGLVLIPLGFVIALVQAVILGGFGLAGVDTTGEARGLARAARRHDRDDTRAAGSRARAGGDGARARRRSTRAAPSARSTLTGWQCRISARSSRPSRSQSAIWVAADGDGDPRARRDLARRCAGRCSRRSSSSRSARGRGPSAGAAELVHGRWLRVASLVGVGALLALVAGPLLGALLIFLPVRRSPC